MTPLNINEVQLFVENNIGNFHQKRLQSLQKLKLEQILRRKNPYLFRAKYILTPNDLVKLLLDAFLSSQEETIFGEFLEQLAIFICEKVHGGQKSSAEGIDLVLKKEEIYYLVAIKSGPNWGNSSQIRKMIDQFKKAQRVYRTNNANAHTICINGCCYGKEAKTDKGDYYKLCGQDFWEFISGNPDLYTDIIEPLGYQAKERNEAFNLEYARIITNFTYQFIDSFCDNGLIDWAKLVRFNSGSSRKTGEVI